MQSIVFYFLGLLAACVSEEHSSTGLKRALDLTLCLLTPAHYETRQTDNSM